MMRLFLLLACWCMLQAIPIRNYKLSNNKKSLDISLNETVAFVKLNASNLTILLRNKPNNGSMADSAQNTVDSPLSIELPPQLEALTVSGNNLGVPLSLHVGLEAESLSVLNLQNCTLRELNLSPLPKLKRLNVAANQLSCLSAIIIDEQQSIETIDASSNKIISVTQLKLPGLRYLNLSRNKIKIIDSNAFLNYPKLYSIDLSYNELQLLPSLNSSSLELLNVDHNQLVLVPKLSLMGLHRLKSLNMTHNALTMESLGLGLHSKSLQILDISHNLFAWLHHNTLRNLPELLSVHFDFNKLSSLEALSKIYRKPETVLSYKDNAFSCNCSSANILQLHDFIKSTNHKSLVCSTGNAVPPKMFATTCHNEIMQAISEQQERLSNKTKWIIGIVIFIVTPIVIAFIYYMNEMWGRWNHKKTESERNLNDGQAD